MSQSFNASFANHSLPLASPPHPFLSFFLGRPHPAPQCTAPAPRTPRCTAPNGAPKAVSTNLNLGPAYITTGCTAGTPVGGSCVVSCAADTTISNTFLVQLDSLGNPTWMGSSPNCADPVNRYPYSFWPLPYLLASPPFSNRTVSSSIRVLFLICSSLLLLLLGLLQLLTKHLHMDGA